MVLKVFAYISILMLCFFTETSLLEQHAKKIKKELSSEYSIDDLVSTEEINRPFAYWETYQVENKTHESKIIIASIFTCNLGGCTAEQAYKKSKTNQEYFDILLELEDEKITRLKVLQYFSDYGYEISSKNYLKKYIGKSVCEFANSTAGIDAFSGATISCDALQNYLGILCSN